MPQNHVRSTTFAVQASLIAAVALFGINAAEAANEITPESWNGNNYLFSGSTTITASQAWASNNGYTAESVTNYSARAEAGQWYNFANFLQDTDVSIRVIGTGGFVPGLTVWATASEFDGGTFFGEVSTAGFQSPQSFNATGVLFDDPGTLWMTNGFGGNAIETLAYAVANPNVNYGPADTGWGETILSGIHDVSLSNSWESGITGNTSAQSATLLFTDLAAGWYTIYIGGTDATAADGGYDLIVSTVPETHTWAMLLAGLGLIGWRLRNSSRESSGMTFA
ncbi:MAG: pyruvate-binding protein [Nitrosomonas sp.]|jgi:hypothetical protein|nr:pyruvate-binding protein [Nitrosomonas sp.]